MTLIIILSILISAIAIITNIKHKD
jgi:hypothetical protein